MSQIPYIPIDTADALIIETSPKSFSVTGDLVSPFDMLEITNDKHFNDIRTDNLHIFVSTDPLYDANYWLMYLNTASLVNNIDNQVLTFYQGGSLASSGAFYFTRVARPFNISKVGTANEKVYPFTYYTRQLRTGVIPNIEVFDQSNNVFIPNFDNLNPDKIYVDADIKTMLGVDYNVDTEG